MKFITVEEHITSNEILEEYRKYQLDGGEMTPDRKKFFEEKALVKGTLTDIENDRLPYMDKTGITMQVLSYINPMANSIPNDKKQNFVSKELISHKNAEKLFKI